MANTSIPVGFVTGFLGSGKTTLIQKALEHPALHDTAVIINEFGEISLDHLLVAKAADTIVELRNGCICCTINQDLTMTLRDLYTRRTLEEVPFFDYVLIETTGIADPGPLIHTITANPAFKGIFHPDAIITCVDMENGLRTLREHETATDQVALADILVLTKADLADDAMKAALMRELDTINPQAERIASAHGELDPERLFRRGLYQPRGGDIHHWMDHGHVHHHAGPHDHGATYSSHYLRADGPISLAGTLMLFDKLVKGAYGQALRVKGIATFAGKGEAPAVLHGVQGRFHPMEWLKGWPDDDHTSRIVVIGRDLDIPAIDEAFNTLCL